MNSESQRQGAGDGDGPTRSDAHSSGGGGTATFAMTSAEGNKECSDNDCSEDSDLEYQECESYVEEEEEDDDAGDDYDFDPAVLYGQMSMETESRKLHESEDDRVLSSVNTLLRHDIEIFRDLLEPVKERRARNPMAEDGSEGAVGGRVGANESTKREKPSMFPFLTTRYLEALGEIDCDIHVPLNNMDLSPQLADAWGLFLDEPLVVRFNFSSQSYLSTSEPPKVEVFQQKKKDCSIGPQLKNMLKVFLGENWPKVDNEFLQSKLKKCESMPCDLSDVSGTEGRGKSKPSILKRIKRLFSNDEVCKKRVLCEDGVHVACLSRLMEMGFKETEARSALMLTKNNLMEASVVLTNMTSSDESKKDPEPAPSVLRPKKPGPEVQESKKRHLSTPVKTRSKTKDCMPRSLSQSHTEPDMSEASANPFRLDPRTHQEIKQMPSLEDGFLVMLYRYIRKRVPSVNEFCVICDNPHIFSSGAMLMTTEMTTVTEQSTWLLRQTQKVSSELENSLPLSRLSWRQNICDGVMPSVCSRELCLFAYQSLGVMSDTMADIATGADVVDLLITMAKAACYSPRKAIIFTPYPNIVDPDDRAPGRLALSEKEKDFVRVAKLLKSLPLMKVLLSLSCTNLSKALRAEDKLLYPLLNWIIYSNRSHIVKLLPEQQLKIMCTPHQFILLSSPPSQERLFQAAKEKHGSTFAFHGSGIENWHSIIRQGLMVASGTKLQMNGAAYGKGIYLSPTANMSASYAGMGYSLHTVSKKKPQAPTTNDTKSYSRFLQDKHLSCMALCEVINSPELKKCNKDIWLCTNESHVCTRFFFVYENGQVHNMDVDMDNPRYIGMVQEALASTFMACVPKVSRTDPPKTVEDSIF